VKAIAAADLNPAGGERMPISTPPLVTQWAPLLVFHRGEDHFPGEPETFGRESRFRESNYKGTADRGWNPTTGRWEDGDPTGPAYEGTPWPTIIKEIEAQTKELRPLGLRIGGKITRPLDDRNLWGRGNHRGFHLTWKGSLTSPQSGADSKHPVPIYHDLTTLRTETGLWTVLHYWFFYMLNWCTVPTHQGDWEHITLYFAENTFEAGQRPAYVYYAAHEGGLLLSWDHPAIDWNGSTHPSVHVLGGHASYPLVAKEARDRYTIRWRTWDLEIPAVEQADWALYDGAWGAAGPQPWMTGPLGPLFKRGSDVVENPRREP
jgi:hypothetical protein